MLLKLKPNLQTFHNHTFLFKIYIHTKPIGTVEMTAGQSNNRLEGFSHSKLLF